MICSLAMNKLVIKNGTLSMVIHNCCLKRKGKRPLDENSKHSCPGVRSMQSKAPVTESPTVVIFIFSISF
jgi:hypothetical protein